MKITSQHLSQILRYEPETGKLFWISSSRASRWVGREAGSNHEGYIDINIRGVRLRAHRAAYMLMTGADVPPGMLIDHANGDRGDNRWCNLRLATRSQNNHNRHRPRRDSKTGVRGVKFRTDRGRYVPMLRIDGKMRKFGSYSTLAEAAERFREIELRYRGENASCLF